MSDGNALMLGGIAGHAGIFASAQHIAAFATLFMASAGEGGDKTENVGFGMKPGLLNASTYRLFTTEVRK